MEMCRVNLKVKNKQRRAESMRIRRSVLLTWEPAWYVELEVLSRILLVMLVVVVLLVGAVIRSRVSGISKGPWHVAKVVEVVVSYTVAVVVVSVVCCSVAGAFSVVLGVVVLHFVEIDVDDDLGVWGCSPASSPNSDVWCFLVIQARREVKLTE
jgi:hypothetical protein